MLPLCDELSRVVSIADTVLQASFTLGSVRKCMHCCRKAPGAAMKEGKATAHARCSEQAGRMRFWNRSL